MPMGQVLSPSLRQPEAMAPEETMMNSLSPSPRRALISPASRWMRGWLSPSAAAKTALPSLSTTRRALLRYGRRISVMAKTSDLLPDGPLQVLQAQAGLGGDQQAPPAGFRVGLEHLLPGKIRG